jgi:hypothetical protein
MDAGPILFGLISLRVHHTIEIGHRERRAGQKFSEGKQRSIALLRGAICTLEGEIAEAQPIVESVKSQSVKESVQESKATQKEDEVRSLQPSLWGGIDLKAAWRRMGRWWRGRN